MYFLSRCKVKQHLRKYANPDTHARKKPGYEQIEVNAITVIFMSDSLLNWCNECKYEYKFNHSTLRNLTIIMKHVFKLLFLLNETYYSSIISRDWKTYC